MDGEDFKEAIVTFIIMAIAVMVGLMLNQWISPKIFKSSTS